VIELKPFGYREAALFHPSYSVIDRARTYFICGGIPAYLRLFDSQKSVAMNLVERVLEPGSVLSREVEFLLREEFRELQNYHALLMTLGKHGSMAVHEIAKGTGLVSTSLPYYLEQLRSLGYVARRVPLTGKRAAPKSARWSIEDPLLRFWFRFVYPNVSFLKSGAGWDVLKEAVQPELDSYFGLCFERLCRESLRHLYRKEGVRSLHEVGEFWSKTVQVDLISIRHDGCIDLGECKWRSPRSRKGLERELETKVREFPNTKAATIVRRLFTRDRVTPPAGTTVRWHCLEDLYS
jgi:hypothetical protein